MTKLLLVHGARANALAQGRSEFIKPVVELLGLPRQKRFPYLLPDGTRAWTMKAASEWCAQRIQRSPRTARRWAAKLAAGKSPFKRIARSDKGRSRFFAQHLKAAAFAAYAHRLTRDTGRAVHRAIARHRKLLGVPAASVPCAETVRVWLRSAAPDLRELMLKGQQTYREIVFSDIAAGLLIVRKDRS